MSMVWKQIGPMPKPVDKLYYNTRQIIRDFSDYYLAEGDSITLDKIFVNPVYLKLNAKNFTATCNDVAKTIGTVTSKNYGVECNVIRINDREFLLKYRLETAINGDGSCSYSEWKVRRFIITNSSLIMSSAITISLTETPSTYSFFQGTLISDNTWNGCEFGGVRYYHKEVSLGDGYYAYPSTHSYNGFFLNGVSSLSLWSTSWTTLCKADNDDNSGYSLDKYGCHYYRESLKTEGDYMVGQGMTSGYCHRINGRNGLLKNMVLLNANGETSLGLSGDNFDFARDVTNNHSCLYGRLNDGCFIASSKIPRYGTINYSNHAAVSIYSFDHNSNIFYKKTEFILSELLNAIEENKDSDFYLHRFYCNNNIWVAGNDKIGMFIYQILGGYDKEYQILYLGKVEAEKQTDPLNIKSQGIFTSRGGCYTLGDSIFSD